MNAAVSASTSANSQCGFRATLRPFCTSTSIIGLTLPDARFAEVHEHSHKPGFIDKLRRFFDREPLCATLALFGPRLGLPLNSQNEHLDFAKIECDRAAFEICITPNRLLLDFADHACFFECLLGGCVVRLAALHGPTLRDHPPPCLPRRDEKHLGSTALIEAKRNDRHLPESERFRFFDGYGRGASWLLANFSRLRFGNQAADLGDKKPAILPIRLRSKRLASTSETKPRTRVNSSLVNVTRKNESDPILSAAGSNLTPFKPFAIRDIRPLCGQLPIEKS